MTARGPGLSVLFGTGARLPIPLIREVDHLAYVMLHVRGTLHDHIEAVRGVRANAGIFCRPILSRLGADGLLHHGDGRVKPLQSLLFRRRIRVGEFQRAVADIAGLCDLCADVVIQVSGEMQDEVTEAVSVWERFLPELRVREWSSQFADTSGVRAIAVNQD